MEKDLTKIALITSEFPPEPGGIGNHAYNLAKYFSNEGFEVSVISDHRLKDPQKEIEFDSKQNFSIKRIKISNIRVFMYFKRIFSSFKIISDNHIVIASGKFPIWLVAFSSFFLNKKRIVVIHGTEVNFKNNFLKKSINFSLNRFHKVIAVSKYTASLVDNLELNDIEVIPNGYEMEEVVFEKLNFSTYPNLITVGSITERKGQNNVIKALPTLIEEFPNIHYHIVGSPTEKEECLTLAKSLKVDNYITFHGKVSEPRKQALISSSDIFIMLSNTTDSGDVEGFGIALIEANHFGIPVIGAKDCGIEDAVADFKSGVLVKNTDQNAILNSMKLIFKDYNTYQVNSKNWAAHFPWKKIIKRYINSIQN